MNCKVIQKTIEQSDPGASFAPAISSHLAECVDCHSFASGREKLMALLNSANRVTAPDDFEVSLARRLAAAKASKGPKWGGSLWPIGLRPGWSIAAGTAAVAIVAISLIVGTHRPSPPLVSQNQTPEANRAPNSGQHVSGLGSQPPETTNAPNVDQRLMPPEKLRVSPVIAATGQTRPSRLPFSSHSPALATALDQGVAAPVAVLLIMDEGKSDSGSAREVAVRAYTVGAESLPYMTSVPDRQPLAGASF